MFGRKARKIKRLRAYLDAWKLDCRTAWARSDMVRRQLAEEIAERKRCEVDLTVTRKTYEEIVRTVEDQLAERPTMWAYGQACKALEKTHEQTNDLRFTLANIASLLEQTWTDFIHDESSLVASLILIRDLARKVAQI